jgi:hypothetical protein
MTGSRGRWMAAHLLDPVDKARLGLRFAAFIADVIKPRFLPDIRPTQFNYPIDMFGKWRGSKYSFITRWRSGWEDNAGEEFDSAWVRLDHDETCRSEARFHVMWHRHTGQWWPYHRSASVEEALALIENKGILHPPV